MFAIAIKCDEYNSEIYHSRQVLVPSHRSTCFPATALLASRLPPAIPYPAATTSTLPHRAPLYFALQRPGLQHTAAPSNNLPRLCGAPIYLAAPRSSSPHHARSTAPCRAPLYLFPPPWGMKF